MELIFLAFLSFEAVGFPIRGPKEKIQPLSNYNHFLNWVTKTENFVKTVAVSVFEALERYSYIYEKLKANGIFTIFFYFFVLVIF